MQYPAVGQARSGSKTRLPKLYYISEQHKTTTHKSINEHVYKSRSLMITSHDVTVHSSLNRVLSTYYLGWESAEILKSIITSFKSIDNRLKSAEVIRPIKLTNAGNSSHFMTSEAPNCTFFVVIC